MASLTRSVRAERLRLPPRSPEGWPVLYEDEEEGDMGESSPHVDSDEILHVCLKVHLAGRPEYRVFSNMNLYYLKGPRHPKTRSLPYVSPDNMVVQPGRELGEDVTSYTLGEDGPAPVLTAEVLSKRSAQQRDLKEKAKVYALLRIPEYILVDVTGRFLPERLLLKRLQPNGRWVNERDLDGGVTSRLGFRVLIDTDGRLRLVNAATGQPYIRPDEAQATVDALGEQVRALQAELARLRTATQQARRQRPNGRRKKK